jgi:hypothetical protein
MQLILPMYFVALLLSGCSPLPTLRMYGGSQLPADQVAIIGSIGPSSASDYIRKSRAYWHYQSSLYTFILEIDGKKLSSEDVNKRISLEVLPGEHRMKVAANVDGKSLCDPEPLIVLAGAGENYSVMARSEEGPEENEILLYFWVIDSSGNIIAGTKD